MEERISTRGGRLRDGLPFTDHALERLQERRVTPAQVELVIRLGAELYSEETRYSFYRIGDKLAETLSAKGIDVEGVKNLVVVVASATGAIVTVYVRSESGLFPKAARGKRRPPPRRPRRRRSQCRRPKD